jgi:hypothetical protein
MALLGCHHSALTLLSDAGYVTPAIVIGLEGADWTGVGLGAGKRCLIGARVHPSTRPVGAVVPHETQYVQVCPRGTRVYASRGGDQPHCIQRFRFVSADLS